MRRRTFCVGAALMVLASPLRAARRRSRRLYTRIQNAAAATVMPLICGRTRSTSM